MIPRRSIGLVAALLASLAFGAQAVAQDLGWTTYTNPRFGYRIDYPAAMFNPPLMADDGNGITLYSPDGRASLFIFAFDNVFGDDAQGLAERLAVAEDIDRVTYRRVTAQWLVLSGYLTNGDIFYQRYEFTGDRSFVAAFRLDFPSTQRVPYEGPIGRIGRSLAPPF